MSTQPQALSEEALLAELGWIRGLARSLVRDAASAEDLAQETYLAALERPPRTARSGASLRAWLAKVTRTLARTRARGEKRRELREARVAKFDRDDSDLIEAVELRRAVVGAVLELDEPYRTTLLRFHFEERSAKEIAASSGESEDVVRQRLVRGRKALRERLQQTFGQGERGWIRALLPLLLEEPFAPENPKKSPFLLAAKIAAVVLFFFAGALALQMWSMRGELKEMYAYEPQEPKLVPDREAAWERGGLARWLVRPPGGDEWWLDSPEAAVEKASFGLLGPEEVDLDAEITREVSVDVTEVEPLEFSASLAAEVAAHSGHPVELIQGAELFAATCKRPRRETLVPCHIVRMPLAVGEERARVTVVVVRGRALTMGAWGKETFDEDTDLRWVAFLGQLLKIQENGPVLDLATINVAELRDRQRNWEEQDDEGSRFLQALLAQRVAMAGNAVALRAKQLAKRGGTPPPPAWYEDLAVRMEALADHSPHLTFVLGEEGVGRHAEAARASSTAYVELAEALRQGDEQGAQEATDRLSAACKACHDSKIEDGVTTWFDAFDPFVEELELPIGYCIVGMDIAPAPGDDGVWSKRVADAFRAALVLANESRNEDPR